MSKEEIEKEQTGRYSNGIQDSLKGRSQEECIEILMEKVEYWFVSARFWRNRTMEASMELNK